MGRFSEATEVVNAIEWLSSEKASYVVGHTLVVDRVLSLT
jgi:NAD(P)-dependent dehydrogenase (short-subunit alcohol dehydrogenase family)